LILSSSVIGAGAERAPDNSNFTSYCASCHGKALGGGFGPPLSGPDFKRKWQAKGTKALFEVVSKTMPPGKPNQLDPQIYQEISDSIFVFNRLPVEPRTDEIKNDPVTAAQAP
jgi:mono/diheme cytochrome c family protein